MQDSNWLNSALPELQAYGARLPVLELGCGPGIDSSVMTNHGLSVVAVDQLFAGLDACSALKNCLPVQADISKPLPFSTATFGAVLASLSLHYFPWRETMEIMSEIKRVLVRPGLLIIRVNATDDINFGAGQGQSLETDYYLNDGRRKRFFDQKAVELLLSGFVINSLAHRSIDRYGKTKQVWEARAVIST